ncbi:hyaluronoglucosaminidase [Knoellia remsis]|uniref:Hyaluronoglucosaminidase n=1 Tax=Knoellia remsis TaxID=407159 RepID=A0A2T0UQ99_9MICO|nr:beta-N-acetylglucosaminidase domain-containing protein [Knoellia remsis]PRY60093.1 hyaluronoglucosaminidase [Knoellia remsis]
MLSPRRATAAGGLLALVLAGTAVPLTAQAAPAPTPLPTVTPTPQSISRAGADIALPGNVEVVVDASTDAAARTALRELLAEHGVGKVTERASTSGRAPLTIHLGAATRADVTSALGATGVPTKAEGYAVRVDGSGRKVGRIALGGADGAGQFYAVQTLDQLLIPQDDGGFKVAGASVNDFPAMPLRGATEGFYGNPWTHAERLDQLKFYGDMKANTYIYAPKDDPYHRDRWREPYPADKLAELTELVKTATANHVRFTFALSPGNTVCYSSEADYQAVVTKFEQMYAVGVRAFNVALDDINLSRWSCAADQAKYGSANATIAGRAQAELLTRLQKEWIETKDGTFPLQMVPTEYYNTTESGYKRALRTMDEDVVVMWTGNDVVPQSISIAQAQQAATVFGGPTFLWDNYPVNDYGNTSGRLLLGKYVKREPGLSQYLAGIVSNPMNQAAASKIVETAMFDFSWNDTGYDADEAWVEAMRYLAGDDEAATAALRVFADLNAMAPTFGQPWQPQAPELKARIDAFWATWESGDKAGAITTLRAYAEAILAAPTTIRAGAVDPGFVSDAKPWLDATLLWGRSTIDMLDALQARLDGDKATSDAQRASSAELSKQAAAVRVLPADNTWGEARVKIADGVLDTFLARAGLTLDMWEIGDAVNIAPQGTASASSVEQDLARFQPRYVNDNDNGTRWASGYTDGEWVQVKLAEPTAVSAVTVKWEPACATAYKVQTSVDGQTWTTVKDVTDTTCNFDIVTFDQTAPVNYVRIQGVDRASTWGYSIWEIGIYAAK